MFSVQIRTKMIAEIRKKSSRGVVGCLFPMNGSIPGPARGPVGPRPSPSGMARAVGSRHAGISGEYIG